MPNFFPLSQVLQSDSFFWVGRGGFAITHTGNARVRQELEEVCMEYQLMKRSERGRMARSVHKKLKHVKFVVPRDVVLENMEEDDNNLARGIIRPRKLGLPRRRSLMQVHNSIDQIRSYPEGTCIDVGHMWARDIINHLLREDAKTKKQVFQELALIHSESDDEERSDCESVGRLTEDKSFYRVFDKVLPVSVATNTDDESLVDFCCQLFPAECGNNELETAKKEDKVRQQTTTGAPSIDQATMDKPFADDGFVEHIAWLLDDSTGLPKFQSVASVDLALGLVA